MAACDKILGVYVDENLLWNEQFNHISKTLSTNLWHLRKHRLLFYSAYISNPTLNTAVLYGVQQYKQD